MKTAQMVKQGTMEGGQTARRLKSDQTKVEGKDK